MPKNYAPPAGPALDEELATIRTAVFDEIDRDSRRPRRLRPVLITVGAAVAVGAVVVAGATGLGGASPHSGASAEAATVLTAAAQNAITTKDPVVGPGQYLEVSEKEISIGYGLKVGNTWPAHPTGTTTTIYIPHDASTGTWTLIARRPLDETALPSGSSATQVWAELAAHGQTTVESAVGGHIDGYMSWDPVDFSRYSRDPQAFLDQLTAKWQPGGQPKPNFDFFAIRDLLGVGNMPADLRATAYRALTLLPGVSVVDREAALDGTTGVAIGLDNTHNGEREDLIVDPATGVFIGERTVATTSAPSTPAGTVTEFSKVTTTVVDAVPAGE